MSDLWSPLLLSMQIAGAATLLCVILAVPLALLMSRSRFRGKTLVDALIVVPMVMPPTVVGYAIVTLLGTSGWLGAYLHRVFDYSIIFRLEGAVLAALIVAFPMLYVPAKAGFASVERDLEDVARLLGANQLQVFWHVTLPLAQRGIYSGLLLAFARAIGEFGATMMVFGWQANRLTLPISIYSDYEQGKLPHAAPAVAALVTISLSLMAAHNRSSATRQE